MLQNRLLALFLCLILLSCNSVGDNSWLAKDDAQPEVVAEPEAQSLLVFPPTVDQISLSRQTSKDTTVIDGDDLVSAIWGNSYQIPEAHEHVIIPDATDEIAWALYNLGGLDETLATDIGFSVKAEGLEPGGDDELPLKYWIGMSDYTLYTWEWYGPFTEPTEFVFNQASEDLVERYIDQTGVMSFIVLVDSHGIPASPGNPQGLACAGVVSSSIGWDSADLVPNKPMLTMISEVGTGAGSKRKTTSELPESQWARVTWEHIFALSLAAEPWEADNYRVFRRGPDDWTPVWLGTVFAPTEEYYDPDDNLAQTPPVPDPVPGVRYRYYLRAENDHGLTGFSEPVSYTIPILPPDQIRAELNEAGDQVFIEWSEPNGALSYRVMRRIGAAEVVEIGTTNDAFYYDTTLPEATLAYYSVIAVGRDASSDASLEARAYMSGPGVSVDLGDGVMIEFVYVPAGDLQLGSPSDEWSHSEKEEVYQTVSMDAYYISKTEITNAMFEQFIDNGGYEEPSYWGDFPPGGLTEPAYWSSEEYNSGPGYPNYPVLGISWPEANAFANWIDSLEPTAEISLPTEAEWEYAAEGPTSIGEIWLFPWPELREMNGGAFNTGDDGLDMARANTNMDIPPDEYGDTTPVGSFPLGRSWCGALDMSGNVYEWLIENYVYPYPEPYIPSYVDWEDDPYQVTVRGGSFNGAMVDVAVSAHTYGRVLSVRDIYEATGIRLVYKITP